MMLHSSGPRRRLPQGLLAEADGDAASVESSSFKVTRDPIPVDSKADGFAVGERIETLVAKAKEVRQVADNMVQLGKEVESPGPDPDSDLAVFYVISAYTSIQSFKGSPYWMAPEAIMNGNGYNLPVDIWSLGCTILEMATSKPPWSQYEGVPAIFKIANSKEVPEIPEHLSSDAKSFLTLCLQRDPAARPTAAQLMDHPFVRDQTLAKATTSSMFRDMLPSISAGTQRMATMDLSPNRSISPLRDTDYGVGHLVEFPSASRNPSDLLSMRMNMSLPVSPCSSPLRQFKQTNRSCLPSPPHPAYSAGAINYGPSNYSLYHTRACNNLNQWPDNPQLKAHTPPQLTPYGSPRR